MAGSFSGWVINSLIGSNRDFLLDWKRLVFGLALAVVSISLPVTPLIGAGEPLVALSVAGLASFSVIVVKAALKKRVPIASGRVGLLVLAGVLVFFLAAFSVSYVWYSFISYTIPILIWAQCLTLIAPSLVLFRLLVRSFDFADIDHSSGWDRRKIA